MDIRYFKDGQQYIAVTSVSPRKFKGVLFVGKQARPGCGPETVYETAFATNQFEKWTAVEKDDVPPEWLKAFGYELEEIAEPTEPKEKKVWQRRRRASTPTGGQTFQVSLEIIPWNWIRRTFMEPTPSPEQRRLNDKIELLILLTVILLILTGLL